MRPLVDLCLALCDKVRGDEETVPAQVPFTICKVYIWSHIWSSQIMAYISFATNSYVFLSRKDDFRCLFDIRPIGLSIR